MSARTLVRVAFAVTTAIGLGALALYVTARSDDPENYRRAMTEVRHIQQLAADWSVATARAKANPLADYDELAAFIPEMARRKEALLATVGAIPDLVAGLVNQVSAFTSAVSAREERIERFKTANAVVRNSARFLPLAASNIVRSGAADAELTGGVRTLANGINEYIAAPNDAAKGRLTAMHERLSEEAGSLPEELATAMRNFLNHARVLLDRQASADRIFREATSNDVSTMADALVVHLGDELEASRQRNALLMNAVWAAAAVLLLLWIAVALMRIRAPARGEARGARGAPAPVRNAEGAVLPEGAAIANGAGMDGGELRLDGSAARVQKLLIAHRIACETVGERIAELSRGVTGDAETLATAKVSLAGADGEEAGAIVPRLHDVAGEIGELAQALSSASGSPELSYALVDLNDCVVEAIAAVADESVARVVVEAGEVPDVFACRTEICVILEKVLENSVRAVREKDFDDWNGKGEIRIVTAANDTDATVTVIDNGIGVEPEVRARMFDPFFTTASGRAGLGLAVTNRLVAKYGGRISVGSHPGGGTVTRIALPGMRDE